MSEFTDQVPPDQDLIDDLVKTVNRHISRMTVGNVFASLMVVASSVIHSKLAGRPPSPSAISGLCQLAAHFLAKPQKPANPKSILELQ
jgi:hypothetical protein